MREIKYRAYIYMPNMYVYYNHMKDKKMTLEKGYYNVENIDFDDNTVGVHKIVDGKNIWYDPVFFSDIYLEQYTGLKDKNGVEIYEGDLVRDESGVITIVKYGYQIVDAFEGVGYNLWSFYGDDLICSRLQSEIEVIGNIHEDKELLKKCTSRQYIEKH